MDRTDFVHRSRPVYRGVGDRCQPGRVDGLPERPVHDLSRRQAGIITTAQARACGLTGGAVRARLDGGRWQRVYPGIHATFSGPLTPSSRLWAALLLGGEGAVLSHETAAELDGLIRPGDPWAARTERHTLHVTVPHPRAVRSRHAAGPPRIVFHRSSRIDGIRHPTRLPPRTRIEDTAVDLAQAAPELDRAIAWLAAGCQRRLTTPARLLDAMARRGRLRWRRELREALGDVVSGAETLLELRFLHRVERAHGLPRSRRQVRRVRRGLVRYDDAEYEEYGVVVELDGGMAHPEWDRTRDRGRDNITAELGGVALRYGWGDVCERPCETAAQLARTLALRGWTGRPHPCRAPGCALRTTHDLVRST